MSLSLLRTGRSRVATLVGAIALVVGSATGAVALGAGSAAAAPPSASPQVVPKPVSTTVGVGQFTLTHPIPHRGRFDRGDAGRG